LTSGRALALAAIAPFEVNMLFRKMFSALKMFCFGWQQTDLLTEQAFVAMSKLFEHIFQCVNDDRPYSTHLYLGGKRVASMWMYPGLSKNPIDRITDLLSEIAELKEAVQQPLTEQSAFASQIAACSNCKGIGPNNDWIKWGYKLCPHCGRQLRT
jgi:hypothetical protein